jgi:hypothetical protein
MAMIMGEWLADGNFTHGGPIKNFYDLKQQIKYEPRIELTMAHAEIMWYSFMVTMNQENMLKAIENDVAFDDLGLFLTNMDHGAVEMQNLFAAIMYPDQVNQIPGAQALVQQTEIRAQQIKHADWLDGTSMNPNMYEVETVKKYRYTLYHPQEHIEEEAAKEEVIDLDDPLEVEMANEINEEEEKPEVVQEVEHALPKDPSATTLIWRGRIKKRFDELIEKNRKSIPYYGTTQHRQIKQRLQTFERANKDTEDYKERHAEFQAYLMEKQRSDTLEVMRQQDYVEGEAPAETLDQYYEAGGIDQKVLGSYTSSQYQY